MAWIELHQNMPGHKRTRRVKTILGVDTPTAVGHLCLLWLWALDNAEDGRIGDMLPQEIADVCEYKGDADQFVDALVEAGYLVREDDDIVIHDWADYCGKLMDQRTKNRIRQANYRARRRNQQEEEPEEPVPSPADQPDAPEPAPEKQEPKEPPAMRPDPEFGRLMTVYMDKVNPTPSRVSIDELKIFCDEMGADVCIHAIEYALDERKGTWSYIRGTLRAYHQRGIKNMTDLQKANAEFENAKRRREDTQNGKNRRYSKREAPQPEGGDDPLRGFHTAG